MMESEKPFRCIQCNLCFATTEHLVVHQRMHTANENCNEISSSNRCNNSSICNNGVVSNSGSTINNDTENSRSGVDHLLVKMPNIQQTNHSTDQTPTPTRFVKCSDMDGSVLFEDINPFEQDFKIESSKRAISSTVNEVCPSQESIMKSPYKRSEVAYKLAKILPLNPENENGANSLDVHGTPNPACAVQMAKYKAEANQRLADVQNTGTASAEQTDFVIRDGDLSASNTQVFVSSNCRESLPSCSSAIDGANTSETLPQPGIATSNPPNEDSAETSLHSLLQQLQKESTDVNKSSSGPVAQSQEALREQLKSLIKSGQIKIKFTSDPSSPKVQATIVGNITKKAAVKTTLPTMVSDINTTRPTMVQSMLSTARPTMVPEMLPKRDDTTHKASSPPPKKIAIKENEGVKVTSPTTPQLVPRFQKVPIPAAIQILPKPLFKPIAPKTTSDTSTPASIVSQRPVLPATDALNGGPSSITGLHSNSNLVFAKQKLKQSLQQNISNKPTDMSTINGHVSMVASSGSGVQKKYKNIVLDMYHTPNSNATASTTISPLCHSEDNKRKHLEEDPNDPKRQKFLERNRAAASRCRQKRKIWVNQLETKSDNLLKTNSLLLNEINALRSEVLQLKSLLLAHKDCPVTKQQKALLGQMTPGSYIAAVSDGQIIAIHQIPEGGTGTSSSTTTTTLSNITSNLTSSLPSNNFNISSSPETKLAEELASSALTDMAARATQELGIGTSASSVTVQSNIIAISSSC